MSKRRCCALTILLIFVTLTPGFSQGRRGRANEPPPEVTGAWTGTWSIYSPAQGAVPGKEVCASLTANVVRKDTVFEATFEGDCGRPYKYSIKMEGRLVGNAVLFKGTVDLGPQDGGVYDWIGRATTNEFFGFYTSGASTGVFNLTRPK